MGRVTNTNCGVCWTQYRNVVPGTWAHIDGKDVDFYCDPHLRTMGIDIAECETVEAWRRENGLSAPPAPVRMAPKPTAVSAAQETAPSQPLAAPVRQPAIPVHQKPTEARKPKEQLRCASCGNRLKWGWPDTICRGCRNKADSGVKTTEPPTRRGRPPKTSSVASEAKVLKSNGHKEHEVAGLAVSLMPFDEYRETFPLRNSYRAYDPIVSFVAAMDRSSVARFQTPKGQNVKSFRDRIAKLLQLRHKLPVTVEQNSAHKCIAVIWKAEA